MTSKHQRKVVISFKFQKVLTSLASTTDQATILALEDVVQLDQNILTLLPNYLGIKRQIEDLRAAMQGALSVEVTPSCMQLRLQSYIFANLCFIFSNNWM